MEMAQVVNRIEVCTNKIKEFILARENQVKEFEKILEKAKEADANPRDINNLLEDYISVIGLQIRFKKENTPPQEPRKQSRPVTEQIRDFDNKTKESASDILAKIKKKHKVATADPKVIDISDPIQRASKLDKLLNSIKKS